MFESKDCSSSVLTSNRIVYFGADREAIGTLIYLVIRIRLDVSFAVGKTSEFRESLP